jgi:murein DD-endopeptidase MepM/ murein hydrolase activator NlpD
MSAVYNPGSAFRKSSLWNPNRLHPVTRQYRTRRGDDWAAPEGISIPQGGWAIY